MFAQGSGARIVTGQPVGLEGALMSALGQKQTFAVQNAMSALPPIADIGRLGCDVRFVPIAAICTAAHECIDRGSARRDWRLRKTRLEWLDGIEGDLLGERGKLLALLGQRLQLISRMAS